MVELQGRLKGGGTSLSTHVLPFPISSIICPTTNAILPTPTSSGTTCPTPSTPPSPPTHQRQLDLQHEEDVDTEIHQGLRVHKDGGRAG